MSGDRQVDPDFLDEMIAKRSERSASFPALLDAALKKRDSAGAGEHADPQVDRYGFGQSGRSSSA